MTQINGGCKCGRVSYSAEGPEVQVVSCHCSMCRGLTGAAFSTYVVVREGQFRVTEGSENVASYEVTDRTTRHFCPACGTPLFNSNPETYSGLRMLYVGTVVGADCFEPKINIFCESQLPWVTVPKSSKSFPRTPRRDA